MSALERSAKPILTPLVRGEPTVLNARDQELVSTWLVKTALMVRLVVPNSEQLAEEHCLELFRAQAPPSGMDVWIGAIAPTTEIASFLMQPADVRGPANLTDESLHAYSVVMRIGGLMAHVTGAEAGASFGLIWDLDANGPLARATVRLWPVRHPEIAWPKVPFVTEDDLSLLERGWGAQGPGREL